MKKNVKKSKRQTSKLRRSTLAGLEPLEERQVLAANVLASGMSSLSALNATQDVILTVATPDAATGAEAVLGIEVSEANNSGFDPAAVTVIAPDGSTITPLFSDPDVDTGISRSNISVAAGVYTVQVSGDNSSAGDFQIDVSLLGDVNAGDGTVGSVSTAEQNAAQLAFVQANNTGNFVTDLFFRVHGLTADGTVDAGFDSNGDGSIDSTDLAAIGANADLGTVQVTVEVDGGGPEIGNIRLVTDTGTSASDGITTNPNVLVDISDNSLITSVTASINNGTGTEISSLVGDFNSTGSFLLDAADLTAINGGTAVPDGPLTIDFTGTDELGNVSDPVSFSYTLITNNLSPTTIGVADQTATEDVGFTFNISSAFSDANTGDTLTFSAAGLPSWLTLDSTTGVLSGTPENADVGTTNITLTATDSQGALITDTFAMTVTNVNDPPTASAIGTQFADEDDPFTLNLNNFFSDEDGDTLSFAVLQATGFDAGGNFENANALPSWLTETNGVLSGTPTDGDAGTLQIGVIALDSAGEQATALFDLTVTDLNDAPTLVSAIGDQTATEDSSFSLNLNSFFTDVDPGDSLNITATGLPSSLAVSNGTISGTPADADVGVSSVTVTATDTFGASVSDSFTLTVGNVNDVPVASNVSFVVDPTAANGTQVGTVIATDDDTSDTTAFAIVSGNADGAFAINAATGLISLADASQLTDQTTETLTVEVTDGAGATDNATVTITVTSNFAPTANDDSGFTTSEANVFTIDQSTLVSNDTDPDGDTLSVSAVNGTSTLGAAVTLLGNNVVYDPTVSTSLVVNAGETVTDTFTYTVSDGNGGTDTATVQIVITSGPASVAYNLEILDSTGNLTSSVDPGDTFTLVVLADDLRTNPQGLFAAYLDVNYAGANITPSGAIVHSPAYSQTTFGTNTTAGLLDEVGGLSSSFTPPGGGELEVFRQQFVAGATEGVVNFTSDAPENQTLRGTLLFGLNTLIPPSDIDFGTTTLTIGDADAAAGIVFNPNDVNGDGLVSPMDALVVINQLNGLSSSLDADVNNDGLVTPVDALIVLNELIVGSTDTLTGSNSDVSESDLSNALEMLFEDLASDLDADPNVAADLLLELDSPLVDSVFDVINADESEQEALFEQLAAELAELLTN